MVGCLFLAVLSLLFLAGSLKCFAGDVILLQEKVPHPVEEEAIRTVADFYGLQLQTLDVGSQNGIDRVVSRLRNPDTLAVVASQGALSRLDKRKVQAALRRTKGLRVPMLVFGVAARGDANELQLWSGGAIRECLPLPNDFRARVLEVRDRGELSGALAGLELPAVASPTCKMQFEPTAEVQAVLAARGGTATDVAVLIRAQAKTAALFFVPQMQPFDLSWHGDRGGLPKAFSSLAPFILFLSHAAGDYAWHLDGHYANLTIDDAWLVQRYGHLDYAALLVEMEKHNFHTTIAFIPWNFDRSKADIVALFRAHPERFSICVHGNDHTHREFGSYDTNSLKDQVADIKQAVARMERFTALTGIPYDRFMVFPHGVAPEPTFSALKAYEFLGTANAENVPLGNTFPADSAFLLRSYTGAYAGLLSLSRYSGAGAVPRTEIAVQSFLGNPLLFYGHENLFEKGIGAFNPFVDLVKQGEPDAQWTSLGEIARHSHLVRRRGDGGFDVWMFSNEMDLNNPTERDAVFYISKREDFAPAIRSLRIDGAPVAFERSGHVITLRAVIPGRQVRKFRLAYQNDLDVSRENISKSSIYAYILRWISDFRDLHLSQVSWGYAIKQAYYDYGGDSIEEYVEQKWWVGVLCVGLVIAGLRYRRWRAGKRAAETATAD
jgi:hypothetical protein